MISLLSQIVQKFVCWIETALADIFNQFIIMIAAVVGAIAGIMPSMPSVPTLPSWAATGISWVSWFFPIGTLLNVLTFMIAAWLIWIGVATILRWLKVVE
jgi:hypothetical protein